MYFFILEDPMADTNITNKMKRHAVIASIKAWSTKFLGSQCEILPKIFKCEGTIRNVGEVSSCRQKLERIV